MLDEPQTLAQRIRLNTEIFAGLSAEQTSRTARNSVLAKASLASSREPEALCWACERMPAVLPAVFGITA
jgi:hypothetical protein